MQRNTRQRDAIREVFRLHRRPLKIKEILEYGQAIAHTINQATVYRTVKVLQEEGWLVKITHPDAGTCYERAGKKHHHHFHCKQCDKLFELDHCCFDQNHFTPPGFSVHSHEIYLDGICADCGKQQ